MTRGRKDHLVSDGRDESGLHQVGGKSWKKGDLMIELTAKNMWKRGMVQ